MADGTEKVWLCRPEMLTQVNTLNSVPFLTTNPELPNEASCPEQHGNLNVFNLSRNFPRALQNYTPQKGCLENSDLRA